MTAAYIRNQGYIKKKKKTGKTVFKMFTDCKPNLGNMYILGNDFYVYIQDEKKLTLMWKSNFHRLQ